MGTRQNYTGFGYGRFGSMTFGQVPETSTFETELAAQASSPRIRFVFKSHEYDEYVLKVTQIERSGELKVGTCFVTLSNTDGKWNDFYQYPLTDMGKTCNIGLYFPVVGNDDILYLFTGTVKNVSYQDATAILTVQDKMARVLDTTLGGNNEVSEFYTKPWTPGAMAWELLTDYANLSSIKTSQNPDIDYDSWSSWHSDTMSYSLCARFAGQSLRTALLKLGRLTNSLIWVDGESRFKFSMFSTGQSPDMTATVSDAIIDLDVDTSTIINSVGVKYGFSPTTDTWIDMVADANTASQGVFGTIEEIFKDTILWHYTEASATAFAAAFLDAWSMPVERINVHQCMKGYAADLATVVAVTEPLKELSSRPYWIDRIIYTVRQGSDDDGTVRYEGRYAG